MQRQLRQDLQGVDHLRFDWARADLTGMFDWARSILTRPASDI